MFLKYFAGDEVLNDIKRILGYWKPNTQLKLYHSQLHSMKPAEQEVCLRPEGAWPGQRTQPLSWVLQDAGHSCQP